MRRFARSGAVFTVTRWKGPLGADIVNKVVGDSGEICDNVGFYVPE